MVVGERWDLLFIEGAYCGLGLNCLSRGLQTRQVVGNLVLGGRMMHKGKKLRPKLV